VSKNTNRVMVSVPVAVKQRLDRLAAEMLDSRERGNGYSDMELTEQGSRGMWIPLHAVITRALDELESHRKRSNKPKTSRTRKTKTRVVDGGCIHPSTLTRSERTEGME